MGSYCLMGDPFMPTPHIFLFFLSPADDPVGAVG